MNVVGKSNVGTPITIDALLEHFREPNARLAAWLGRDLGAWNHVTPSLKRCLADD